MNNIFSRYKSAVLALGLIAGLSLTSCSDDYMNEMNTDTTKASKVAPGTQLTFALLSTYGDFHAMQTMRSYIAPYTQQYGGSWNSAHHGGANTYADQQTSSLWNAYYQKGIKNLVDAEYNCGTDEVILAAIKVQKVYMLNVLTDIYGDIPVREAGQAYYTGNTTPRYDTQKEVYDYFFTELDEAIKILDSYVSSESLKAADVTSLGGDVTRWYRYANSLKMRLAMRISDVNPSLARTKFIEAADHALTPEDCAYIKYEHRPYHFDDGANDMDFRINAFAEVLYGQDKTSPTGFGMTLYDFMKADGDPRLYRYCRFINDNFRDNTDPLIGREDFTDEVLAAEEGKGVQMAPSCWAWYNNGDTEAGKFPWPTTDCITQSEHYAKFINGRKESDIDANYNVRAVRGMIATDFVLPETPGMLISGAEVCFLKAEAVIKGWLNGVDAETLYKEGIRSALEVVMNQVYLAKSTDPKTKLTDAEINTYVNKMGLNGSDENKRKLINTQAYYLHFANPCEAWANLRRADYPQLYDRYQFGQGEGAYADPEGNMNQPVRLYYPAFEANYNSANYNEAISRPESEGGLGGHFSWHKRMWWDRADMTYQLVQK